MDLILRKLFDGGRLGAGEARALAARVLSGELEPVQAATVLAALRVRGETPEEIGGFARALEDAARPLVSGRAPRIGLGGAGGAGSAGAALRAGAACVLASLDVAVVLQDGPGGEAALVSALGAATDAAPEASARRLEADGLAFAAAKRHHPALTALGELRRSLGVRTILDLAAPLADPAASPLRLLGVAETALLDRLAEALLVMEIQRAFVVCGDGLDALSPAGPSQILAVEGGGLRPLEVDPVALGLEAGPARELAAGSASENAARLRAVLAGEDRGPWARAVALNAAAGLVLAGIEDDWAAACRRALAAIAGGGAAGCLARWAGGS
ncbi:MAG: anthranilate phosphoribosyltransferase [Candidatus Krumholzibacteriota bacterium]|nr:anthranilate phosphoribosyltransferase [Candidatus Krumholzibacteriota bacterium]